MNKRVHLITPPDRIWIVWEYDDGICQEKDIYDIFNNLQAAQDCVCWLEKQDNGYSYGIEELAIHTNFVEDSDE